MGRKKKASGKACPAPASNEIKEHPAEEDEDEAPQPFLPLGSDEALRPTDDNGRHPAEAEEAPPPSCPPSPKSNEVSEQRQTHSNAGHATEAVEEEEQPLIPPSDSHEAQIEPADDSAKQELEPCVVRGHLTEIEEAPISPSLSATDSRTRNEQEEDEKQQQHQQWMQQKKHFIVLTSAGKPVYSRHGDEDALAGLMALTTAMVSVVQDQGDAIQHVTAGTTLIVFLIKGPLYFVASSQLGEPVMVLLRQLEMLHLQIMLVVSSGLERILSRNPSYDARGMLEGMGVVLDNLVDYMQEDATHLLLGVQPLGSLAPPVRAGAMRALSEAVKSSGAVYGLLLAAGGQAVAVERGKGAPSLDHRDVLLLDNFICCNPAFRQEHAETFCPLCLPSYDHTAFLHAYVHFFIPLEEEEWQQGQGLHPYAQGQGVEDGQKHGQQAGLQGQGHTQKLPGQSRQGHGHSLGELEREAPDSQHEGQLIATSEHSGREGLEGQHRSRGKGLPEHAGQGHTQAGQGIEDQGLGSSHAEVEDANAQGQQDERGAAQEGSEKEQGHSHRLSNLEGLDNNQHGLKAHGRVRQPPHHGHNSSANTAPESSTKTQQQLQLSNSGGPSTSKSMRHPVYLVLLSSSPTAFHELSAARATMEAQLMQSGVFANIRAVATGFHEGRHCMSNLPKPLGGPSIAGSPLYHFMARLPHRRQAFRAALLGHPLFSTHAAKASLSRCYAQMYAMMAEPADITGRPSKVLWLATENHVVLALSDSEIELYMVLDPLIDKAGAVRIGEQLRHYLLDLSTRAKNLLSSC